MFDYCQPVLINNLYGSLKINTNDSFSCIKPRQWYFLNNYGYKLLIRFINITDLLSNSYIFKIYSIINKQKKLIYDSINTKIFNNEIQFDVNDKNSDVLVELISIKNKNIQQTSFIIDYVFRDTFQSRYGRQILQDNSSSSSFNSSQPSFIALISVIAFLLLAIIISIIILFYRYYSHRKHSKKRHKIHNKFRQVLNNHQSIDQAHLTESGTPSSISSYSIRSSQHLFSNYYPNEIQQQPSSLGQSISTLPSMIPSRRLQQSIMDAYLNDFNSFQPNIIDPKQLNSYLFIDLHSTSSETFPNNKLKQYLNDNNTTTSGYDTSTGGEDRNYKNSFRYRRRRRYYQQRQRRRSTIALKRSNTPRFIMRERSLPNTLKLPQLRQQCHLFDIKDNNSSTTSNNNQDITSTNLSITTDDYDENHAYHVNNQNHLMNSIEEEKPSIMHKTFLHQPYFFEMVSTYRGDDSDMPNYEYIPRPFKSSPITGDGIAYINDSIIV